MRSSCLNIIDRPVCPPIKRDSLKIDLHKYGLTNYAELLSEEATQNSDLDERKRRGQFFTSKQISIFMAGMFDIRKASFSLLDPGAGIGILSAAFCECLLNLEKPRALSLDAYETDIKLIPYLNKVLRKCKLMLTAHGHTFIYNVINKDFILENPNYLNKKTLFGTPDQPVYYDYVISNPPYYKLNKNSPQSRIVNDLVSRQPNIYSFFMALSLEMLKKDGQMVFITPRSFCSGLYFKRFRKWLINRANINNMHIFESRSNVFKREDVLQENIIIRLTPKKESRKHASVVITKSKDSSFLDFSQLRIDYEDIFHRENGDVFIKVPSSQLDINIQHVVISWKHTLKSFGLKVSTGPVVSFRATKYLSAELKNNKPASPLLWMHNIQGMDVIWPVYKNKKEPVIIVSEGSQTLLLPTRNYVLVKRFSSKEQKKRMHAGVLLKSKLKFEQVGIENHLNYIYKFKGSLSTEEAYGIAGLLNASIIDVFFRMLNGSTQVNAVDIENLPLPSFEKIQEIGKAILDSKPSIGPALDALVVKILKIDSKILNDLREGYSENKKD